MHEYFSVTYSQVDYFYNSTEEDLTKQNINTYSEITVEKCNPERISMFEPNEQDFYMCFRDNQTLKI